jgi:hypothetical protein
MSTMDNFAAYAAAFEETYVDDDWSRLTKYFTDGAVYEVTGGGIDARLEGPDAIFKGMKKSLDGMDRKFDSRTIEVTSEPELTDDTLDVDWTVTYTLGDAPPFVLVGHTKAHLDGDRIKWMRDSYTDEMAAASAAWIAAHAPQIDGSYT